MAISSNRFGRFKKLAALGAQVGTDAVVRGMKKLAGSEEGVVSTKTAERIVSALGELKGAAMKLGQVVSMEPDLLTPEVQAILARLQNQAPPMPYETVAEMIQEELGDLPDKLFARFDREALASASLGQVHAARTHDGREVVVKVQYPGIDEALQADMDNLGAVMKTVGAALPGVDTRAYFGEVESELLREADYIREANNARTYAQAAAGIGELVVPEVIDALSNRRVLTQTRIHGTVLKDFIFSRPSHDERFRVARLLNLALYGPFFAGGVMHADPHPGNFVVMEHGRLGVLDFGSLKQFSNAFVETNRELFSSAYERKPYDILEFSRRVNVAIDLPDDEARPFIAEIFHIAGRPMRSDHYDYGKCTIVKDIKMFFGKNPVKTLKVRPPPEAIMFFRAVGGLSQNLRSMEVAGNFREIYGELARIASNAR